MITRFISICFLVGSFLVPPILPPALSQEEVYTCYFNNQGEPCTVRWVPGGAYQVTWLRDGRVVTYSFFDCVGIPEYGMARCQVGIVEDNGRLSAGVAMLGELGPWIESDNGNSTALPPVCPFVCSGE
jgi:hypothetical protein